MRSSATRSPGFFSRSAATILGGLLVKLDRPTAASFSFLLAIPTIAGGGLLSLLDLDGGDGSAGAIFVGFVVAAISGYAAIAALLLPLVKNFGAVCLAVNCNRETGANVLDVMRGLRQVRAALNSADNTVPAARWD